MNNSREIEVQIINAFVDNYKGGNPAGVVFNADGLNNEQKLHIAREVGLSETAFVSQSDIAAYKLDFFTPTRQIAHCGHATIATFSYLAQQNLLKGKFSSKETIDGIREIFLMEDKAFMQQKTPWYSEVDEHHDEILMSLGLTKNDIMFNAPLSLVNTGNSFAIIPVKNGKALENIKPDYNLITKISNDLDLIGYYVFCTETSNSQRDVSTRMFGPRYGIEEEAGTGMAAGPLACYLWHKLGMKKDHFLIEQGWYMTPASPSLIVVNLVFDHDNNISQLVVGGKSTVVKKIIVSGI